MDSYIGQMVVLRSRWNLQSHRVGLVVDQPNPEEDRLLVMWTIKDGIELKLHVKDALMAITTHTYDKVKERACVFK